MPVANSVEIACSQGFVALVDEADAERVSARPWVAQRCGGGVMRPVSRLRSEGRKTVSLSRFILAAAQGDVVDHINGDPWDNRRANLRVCSRAQNNANARIQRGNRSGFKGVLRTATRFYARIGVGGRVLPLGGYATGEDAARAYDDAAREHFGAFACVNFPNHGERNAR